MPCQEKDKMFSKSRPNVSTLYLQLDTTWDTPAVLDSDMIDTSKSEEKAKGI